MTSSPVISQSSGAPTSGTVATRRDSYQRRRRRRRRASSEGEQSMRAAVMTEPVRPTEEHGTGTTARRASPSTGHRPPASCSQLQGHGCRGARRVPGGLRAARLPVALGARPRRGRRPGDRAGAARPPPAKAAKHLHHPARSSRARAAPRPALPTTTQPTGSTVRASHRSSHSITTRSSGGAQPGAPSSRQATTHASTRDGPDERSQLRDGPRSVRVQAAATTPRAGLADGPGVGCLLPRRVRVPRLPAPRRPRPRAWRTADVSAAAVRPRPVIVHRRIIVRRVVESTPAASAAPASTGTAGSSTASSSSVPAPAAPAAPAPAPAAPAPAPAPATTTS